MKLELFFLFIILLSCGDKKSYQENSNQKFYSTEFNGIPCDKCLKLEAYENQITFNFNNNVNNCVGILVFEKDEKSSINLRKDFDLELNEINEKSISCQNNTLSLVKKNNIITLDGVDIYKILEDK